MAKLAGMVDALKELEHQAILAMNREVRKHPLWTAFKDERGIGEKQFARLLAVIRDPAWNDLYERPPTCRELRAYCGLHVIENAHPGDNATVDGKSIRVAGVAPKRQPG